MNRQQTRRNIRDEMNFDVERYYRINQIFLKMMGLWPTQSSIFIQIYRIIMFLIFMGSSVTQFAKLRSSIHNIDTLLYNLSYAVPSLIYILKFLSYIINADEVKELLANVQHDWNTLRDENEREILRCNTTFGTRYTKIFFGITMPLLSGYVFTLYLPGILDLVQPLNESRPQKLPLLAQYFVIDEQEYFYPLLTYQSTAITLGIIGVLSTETMFLMYISHICGLFQVTCYRLQHAFEAEAAYMSDSEKYIVTHARITEAVKIHIRAMKSLDYLKSTFELSYLILTLLGLITVSVNLFRLFQALIAMNDLTETATCISFIWGQYFYMFLINYFGQRIIDYSIRVFDETYDTVWYTAPVRSQKILIPILQKTARGSVINMTSMLIPSLETFASLTSATLSYVTVIYSVR